MKKRIVAVGAVLMIAATAMAGTPGRTTADKAGNYNFPSPWNPAGRNASEVTQFVAYIWDDNGYSGAYGTEYNNARTGTNWETGNYIGVGIDNASGKGTVNMPSTATQSVNNQDNISETGTNKIGMAWALHDLAKGGKVTGGPVPMTFNMITGLYVNIWGPTWDDRESEFGYYVPSAQEGEHKRIPSVNVGRDMGIRMAGGSGQAQSNSIYRMSQELIAAGAEFGNHTVDHMETNSRVPGPNSQFSKQTIDGYTDFWGVSSSPQFGFATEDLNTTPWGTSRKESDEFGQTVGNTAQNRGWALYAGQFITEQTWKNAIDFGEKIMTKSVSGGQDDQYGGLGYDKNKIYGFRAPRLEVNSGMFYALADLEYLYECGLEEGYETHRNGANYIWPYTTDNGVMNSWTQYSNGERVFVDSMPEGLWQIPVNCVVVPENARSSVYDNYEEVMAGAGTPVASGDRENWLKSGKITAFDFNTWILWGMTSANWKATMENTLKLRMDGNRAPFHYGAHTDYYTNNYDYAVLSTDFNKNGWGLCVTKGWNRYTNRQEGMEWFVTHARGKGAKFVTGKELIDSIKVLVAEGEAKGNGGTIDLSSAGGDWNFNAEGGSIDNANSKSLDNLSGSLTIKPGEEYAVYALNFDEGTLANATHISLDYKQTSASALRLVLSDGTIREVTLAHRYPTKTHIDGFTDNNNYASAGLRSSGMIPISAFDFPVYTDRTMDYSAVDVSKVIAIEIQPLAAVNKQPAYGVVMDNNYWASGVSRDEDYEAKFEFKNLVVHTGTPFDYEGNEVEPNEPSVAIAKVKPSNGISNLSLAGITGNALKLNISQSGLYNVKIFSANGRLLQAFNSTNLTSGVNTLKLNNLASGVYMIKVQGINTKQQLTKSALVF